MLTVNGVDACSAPARPMHFSALFHIRRTRTCVSVFKQIHLIIFILFYSLWGNHFFLIHTHCPAPTVFNYLFSLLIVNCTRAIFSEQRVNVTQKYLIRIWNSYFAFMRRLCVLAVGTQYTPISRHKFHEIKTNGTNVPALAHVCHRCRYSL